MSFESAERIVDGAGRQYHIGVAPGDVAGDIILVGDPERADRLAKRMTPLRLSRASREFRTHTGMIGGREITVMGTGIGCDNTEIAVMELLACRRDATFIRVGSSGALQAEIDVGDVVITTAALRFESTSLGFVDPEYPAVAHYEVVRALVAASKSENARAHAGLTATTSGFYGWQGRRGNILEPRDPDLVIRLGRQGVLNFEMEASTLLVLASLAKVRAGAICTVFASRPRNEFIASEKKIAAEDQALAIALRAFDLLAAD